MQTKSMFRSTVRTLTAGMGVAAGVYAAYAAVAWYRYGTLGAETPPEERDQLLDLFMPTYEIVERHHVRVAAPAAMTLAAAKEQDLQKSGFVRAIFKGRELILGATPEDKRSPGGLLAEVLSLGWGVLADVPEREIVVGAITKPWEPNVTFQSLPADAFRSFSEPGYVKIAWTLRADTLGETASVFRTETRAVATDPDSRARFRLYWSFLSPGIVLIRRMSLGSVRREAERRAAAASGSSDPVAQLP